MTSLQQTAFRFEALTPKPPSRQNLVIEAGAGTGKTSSIVAEVLHLLLGNEELMPERIVLMTFTEKAAGEIADRIHLALSELDLHFGDETVAWPIGSDNPLFVVPAEKKDAYRRACEKQLARVGSIRSQTIQSFCQSLLRAWPIEAKLDPQFKIVEGFERSLLYGQLYDDWLDEETRIHPNEQKLKEWEFLLAHVGYLFQIRSLVFELLSRRDLLEEPNLDFGRMEEIEPALFDALRAIRSSDAPAEGDAATVFQYIRRTDLPPRGSIDALLEYFAPIAAAMKDANLPKDAILKEALRTLRTDKDKGSSIYERLLRHRSAVAIHALTQRFIAFLDEEKKKLGVVDFDDLLLRTQKLLEDEKVLERIRQQFDYLFVDEFQDTDRVQARIVEALATDRAGQWVPGRTTVVGDPKQSIYGFRRADPEMYHALTQRMIATGADERPITTQYRSDAPLLEAINALFAEVFRNTQSNANVFRPPYRKLLTGKKTNDRELDARFTFLHASHEEDEDRYRAEAEAVAEWIRRNRSGGERDLQRFAILFRRTTKIDDYLDALDRYGIDYVLPPTKGFLERRAPVDAVAVLRAIGRPFDLGAEISAARTPYFGLTDEEIAEGVLSPSGAWEKFVALLNGYRDAARRLTVAGTLDMLIGSTDIESVYDAITDGRRARRHLEHLRTLAFEYDTKIGGSIRQFVDEIDRRREEPEETEPSLADDDSNAVRIMTVHAAKGLEFETVILPDLVFFSKSGSDKQQLFAVEDPKSLVMTGRAQSLSAHFRRDSAGMPLKKVINEREEAETRRLFYVAVTRAETDVVFVCNPATYRNDGFLGCLAAAFGFEKDTFDQQWPAEPGRVVRAMRVGTETFPVAFERLAPRDVQQQAAPRLRDAALEAALRADAIVDLELPGAPPVLTAFVVPTSRQRAAGILLHRFLERWDGNGDSEPLLRLLAAESASADGIVEIVRRRIAALRHSPTLQRILAAETIGRELPLRFAGEERRIDRLIRENGREVVIDYKSGAPDSDRLVRDREQVRRYCAAVEQMTGRKCEGLLWYVDVDADVTETV